MYPALIEYTTQLTWGNYEYTEVIILVSVKIIVNIKIKYNVMKEFHDMILMKVIKQ